MQSKKIMIIFCILIMAAGSLYPQARRHKELRNAYAKPDEIVSFTKSMPFNQVLSILSEISKKYIQKVMVDPAGRLTSIGIDIDKQHWMTALEKILTANELWYEEYQDFIKIIPMVKEEQQSLELQRDILEKFNTREVVISAVFFEGDATKLRQAGVSWDFLRSQDNYNVNASNSSADNKGGIFELELTSELSFGDLTTAFKALESQQVGEVIASPQVTVRSNEEGRIQVGSDISVVLQDFAGNAVTQFFSTGSIINVKPEIVQYDSLFFILLDLEIERSGSVKSEDGLEIKKSSAKTKVLLLDGEETIIGGLYVNEESTTREGIPLLKDLPGWFFGLRYLFGFEARTAVKKELLILIKADLLPSLADRVKMRMGKMKKTNANPLRDGRKGYNLRMKYLKDQLEQYDKPSNGSQRRR